MITRLGVWVRRLLDGSEKAVVIVMVAAATMSAYAIWEATERGDQARRALGDIEHTVSLASVGEASIEAQISFDLRLLARYTASLHSRAEMLKQKDWSKAGAHDTERRILSGYFTLGLPSADELTNLDQPGVAYDAPFVAERGRHGQRLMYTKIEALQHRTSELSDSQRNLLVAAVIHATALAAATVADLSQGSRRRAWFAAAVVLFLAGLVLIAWSGGLLRFLFVAGLAGTIFALLAASVRGFRRLRRGSSSNTAASARGIVQWGETLGAITIVLLAGVVLLLANASRHESETLTTARTLQIEANTKLLAAHQRALDDLDAATLLEDLQVQAGFASGQADEGDISGAVREGVVDVLNTRVRVAEDVGQNQRGTQALALIDELSENPYFVHDHLARRGKGAIEKFAEASLHRVTASQWGEKAARYTLAVVVLGLAGYMLALASDRDHHPSTGGWLLTSGIVGLVGGLILAGTALGSAELAPDPDSPQAIPVERLTEKVIESYASGRVALALNHCREAVDHFEDVREAFPRFQSVLADLANSYSCVGSQDAIYSPSMSEVESHVAHLERALENDRESPDVLGSLGWGYLVKGIEDGDRDSFSRSAEMTRQGLEAAVNDPYYMYNLSFAEVALGDLDKARDTFARAVQCTLYDEDPGSVEGGCTGARKQDSFVEYLTAIAAFGDLEMLATGLDLDVTTFKETLLTQLLGTSSSTTSPVSVDFEIDTLDVFPLEVQLTTSGETGDRLVSVVWYHRPIDSEHWGVLINPTLETLSDTSLDEPIDAGILLPGGEYKAEIFVDGRWLAETEPVAFSMDEPHRRWSWPDIGVEAALPADWDLASTQYGFTRHYQDKSGERGLYAARLESWLPSDRFEEALVADIDLVTDHYFDDVDVSTGSDVGDGYFLGMDETLHRTYGNLWVSAGFTSYCDSEDSPGTFIAIWLFGSENSGDPWKDPVLESLRLRGGPDALFTASDCAPTTVELAITDDAWEVVADRPMPLHVLENDGDRDSFDPGSLLVAAPPSDGLASVNSDGSFTYTPDPGYVGGDTFDYEVCTTDGAICGTGTVTLTVVPGSITTLIEAPTDDTCGDSTSTAASWSVLGMPEPIEIWRCDPEGLVANYYRFADTETAHDFMDQVIEYHSEGTIEIVYDGTWHRGDESVTPGRLYKKIGEDTGGYGLRSADLIWTYDEEAIVGWVYDHEGEMATVEEWWTDNA